MSGEYNFESTLARATRGSSVTQLLKSGVPKGDRIPEGGELWLEGACEQEPPHFRETPRDADTLDLKIRI